MKEPQVVIIYVPGDGQMHMMGARRHGNDWRYSKPVLMPESDLNDFIAWRKEEGMSVLDVRDAASVHTPGMGKATPIIMVQRGVTMHEGVSAMKRLHEAILAAPSDR